MVVLALAGGLGAAARFVVDTLVTRRTRRVGVPVGTLVVNATACLLLGALTGWLLAHPGHEGVRAVLGVGFLGGYSTFSTASVEAVRLLLAGRAPAAVAHALLMLTTSLGAALAGLWLTSP